MGKLVQVWKAAVPRKENIPETDINRLDELIESGLDAVDTISSCSAHQKRIVDDILTYVFQICLGLPELMCITD